MFKVVLHVLDINVFFSNFPLFLCSSPKAKIFFAIKMFKIRGGRND